MLKQWPADWSQEELTFVNVKIVYRKVIDLLNLFLFLYKMHGQNIYIDAETS